MPTLGRTTGLSKPKIHIDSATAPTPAPEAPRKWVNRKVPVSAIVVVGFGVLVAVAVGIVLLVGILGNTKNTSELLQDKGESVVNLVERDIRAQWLNRHGSQDLSPMEMSASTTSTVLTRLCLGLSLAPRSWLDSQ